MTWIVIGLGIISVVGTLVGAYNLMLNNSLISATTDQAIPVEEGIVNFILPGALPSALGVARTVGSWLLIIFTAIFIGMEDAWGTLRVMLSTGISRGQYLAGKLGALLVVVVGFVLVALVSGGLTAVFIQNTTSIPLPDQAANGRLLGSLFLMSWRVVVALYVPVLLTFCTTILSRSQVTGIAIGLGYFLFEAIMKNAFNSLGAVGDTLRPLLIGYDIATLMELNSFHLDRLPELSPSVGEAWLALGVYGVLFVGLSWFVFMKRDITSARGS
ncbi:MAG: ABC transporter permease subunit [Anaerolineae bacterium]|nr:ABC transporter permease subunit [Anaerolineae bacterium]